MTPTNETLSRRLLLLCGALGLGTILVSSPALWADDDEHDEDRDHVMVEADEVEWQEGPRSLPPGAEMALLSGSPGEPGPFTMRLRFPAGYRIPPHWHPRDEHVTVLEGTFHMALGEEFDRDAGQELSAGGFAHMAPEVRHFAWTERGTTVQVHGVGPWGIEYVDPEDDPRKGERED